MFSKSVPERINSFLVEHKDEPYCDSCIQQWLGLKWRQQVQLITATLSVTPRFRRDRGFCCSCRDHKRVIAALSVPAEASPGIATAPSAIATSTPKGLQRDIGDPSSWWFS